MQLMPIFCLSCAIQYHYMIYFIRNISSSFLLLLHLISSPFVKNVFFFFNFVCLFCLLNVYRDKKMFCVRLYGVRCVSVLVCAHQCTCTLVALAFFTVVSTSFHCFVLRFLCCLFCCWQFCFSLIFLYFSFFNFNVYKSDSIVAFRASDS